MIIFVVHNEKMEMIDATDKSHYRDLVSLEYRNKHSIWIIGGRPGKRRVQKFIEEVLELKGISRMIVLERRNKIPEGATIIHI